MAARLPLPRRCVTVPFSQRRTVIARYVVGQLCDHAGSSGEFVNEQGRCGCLNGDKEVIMKSGWAEGKGQERGGGGPAQLGEAPSTRMASVLGRALQPGEARGTPVECMEAEGERGGG